MDVESWDEIVGMVEQAVSRARPGELIRGRGWHQEKWNPPPARTIEGLPTHHSLSAVSPENPVVLRHASGHATFANAMAMEMAGVTRDTSDPEGGQIVRDEAGDPIGAFRETASGLLGPAQRNASRPDPSRLARLAAQEVLSKGITTFQDAGTSLGNVDMYRELAESGELGVRLWVMLRASNEELATALPRYRMVGVADNHLTVRAIKRSIDGALGSHGAWLLDPYEDLPSAMPSNPGRAPEPSALHFSSEHALCVEAIRLRVLEATGRLEMRSSGEATDEPAHCLTPSLVLADCAVDSQDSGSRVDLGLDRVVPTCFRQGVNDSGSQHGRSRDIQAVARDARSDRCDLDILESFGWAVGLYGELVLPRRRACAQREYQRRGEKRLPAGSALLQHHGPPLDGYRHGRVRPMCRPTREGSSRGSIRTEPPSFE